MRMHYINPLVPAWIGPKEPKNIPRADVIYIGENLFLRKRSDYSPILRYELYGTGPDGSYIITGNPLDLGYKKMFEMNNLARVMDEITPDWNIFEVGAGFGELVPWLVTLGITPAVCDPIDYPLLRNGLAELSGLMPEMRSSYIAGETVKGINLYSGVFGYDLPIEKVIERLNIYASDKIVHLKGPIEQFHEQLVRKYPKWFDLIVDFRASSYWSVMWYDEILSSTGKIAYKTG